MAKQICPLIKKKCIEHDCAWYTHMQGMNPQTGAIMDQHSCAVQWLPLLLTEQARSTRGVQAAVESHRNEATKSAAELNEKLAGAGAFMGMVDAVARQSAQLPAAAARAILPYVDNE